MKPTKALPRGSIIASLDVGSSKVVCFIARVEEGGNLRLIGIGHQVSRGMRSGTIVDLEETQQAIAAAVHQAETMAGQPIRKVIVNVSGNHLASHTVSVDVAIAGHAVGDADVNLALAQARHTVKRHDVDIVHALPGSFAIDGNTGIRDPRGMYGDRLAVDVNVVTASATALRNLKTAVARAHLGVEDFCASGYAAGLAALVEDERELGATCIDLGGGTTSIAVFIDGEAVYTDCIPVGGQHVTSDIARGLTTSISHAERIKALHGAAMGSQSDDREAIEIPQVGEDDPSLANHVPRSILISIMQPRLEEVFELVRDRLQVSGLAKAAGRRVVLTGGASDLPAIADLAQLVLDKQVRVGRPLRLTGLPQSAEGPAFAATAGLLHHAVRNLANPITGDTDARPSGSLWGRVGAWLKENL